MDESTWASLPCDLLVDIFRRLDSTAAFVRSACVCKPWRRTIIGNASSLGPRAAVLLGFFHSFGFVHHRSTGPFADVLTAAAAVDWTSYVSLFRRASSSSPAAIPFVTGNNVPYPYPLSSRDGFVLLAGGGSSNLCLCNAMTGLCKVIHAAAPDMSAVSYVVVTAGDSSAAVWTILAVKRGENVMTGMTYQIFSSESGEWGPIKRSARLLEEKGMTHLYMYGEPKDAVVISGDGIYWLGDGVSSSPRITTGGGSVRRVLAFAIDVGTERTWTMELPEKYMELDRGRDKCFSSITLATSGDGRLSLVVSLPSRQIEVWVLVGDDGRRWTMRRMIDVPELVPECCRTLGRVWLKSYCFRSGRLFVDVDERDLLIDVDEELPDRRIQRIVRSRVSCYPYEMDWSTYISRMKYF